MDSNIKLSKESKNKHSFHTLLLSLLNTQVTVSLLNSKDYDKAFKEGACEEVGEVYYNYWQSIIGYHRWFVNSDNEVVIRCSYNTEGKPYILEGTAIRVSDLGIQLIKLN